MSRIFPEKWLFAKAEHLTLNLTNNAIQSIPPTMLLRPVKTILLADNPIYTSIELNFVKFEGGFDKQVFRFLAEHLNCIQNVPLVSSGINMDFPMEYLNALTSLKSLNLSKNPLSGLKENVWSAINKLAHTNLKMLDLSFASEIPSDAFNIEDHKRAFYRIYLN